MSETMESITQAVEKAIGKKKPGGALAEAQGRLKKLAAAKEVPEAVKKELRAIAALLGAATGKAVKSMTVAELAAHVVAEIQKAADDEPDRAAARLALVQAAVAKAAQVLKQSYVDVDSEKIKVEVFQEATTELAENSDRTGNILSVQPEAAPTAFASNPEDLAKVIEKLREQLATLTAKEDEGKKPEKDDEKKGKEREPAKKREPEPVWPLDLASKEFREGVEKRDADWGLDPWAEE
ncbi:MAG: hypothetical protein ACYCWW_13165 [Deltaproteobacteria bacterium]